MLISGNSKSSIIDSNVIGQILDKNLSPKLARLGLLWNGKDLWFDHPRQSIRRVFKYCKLKGASGTFAWGVCLDFVPTISSNKLKFHKTDKSVLLHLFEWTDEYANSFYGGKLTNGMTSHWGKHEAEKSITKLFDKYELKISNWFDQASTIENLKEISEEQIQMGQSYNLHSPDPNIVLAFLQARLGQVDKATNIVNALTLDESQKELYLTQLKKAKPL